MHFNSCLQKYFIPSFLATAALTVQPIPARAETSAVISHAKPTERTSFDVYLPLRNKAGLQKLVEEQTDETSPRYHKWLTQKQFADRFGPDITSTSRVTAALRKYGFQVGALDNRVLRVVATAGAVERALGVKLNHARFTDGTEALVADRALALDATLAAEGVKIPTFTSVAPMHIHSRSVPINPDNYKSATGPYLAADLRQAYQVPAVTAINGKGVVIGILMTGAYLTSDITDYFNYEDVDFSLRPTLQVKNINGGAGFNSETSPETELDITQSSGIALGATEMLYNLSGLDQPTILYGLNEMVSDNVVDVVNMSFGGPEIANTPKYNNGVDQSYLVFIENELFLQGNAQGISFFASSGDHGANPPVGKTRVTTVELPAGDPNVTAVGGTNLITKFTHGSTISSYTIENADYDQENGEIWGSGGGYSIYFAQPKYQALVKSPNNKARVVPDIAGHMGGCPGDMIGTCATSARSSDVLFFQGQVSAEIGTSASSPDTAGLFALRVKKTGERQGNVNPLIYKAAHTQLNGGPVAFHHDDILGSNGVYTVKAPFDPVIGNGTPYAGVVIGFPKLSKSGNPNTNSNP